MERLIFCFVSLSFAFEKCDSRQFPFDLFVEISSESLVRLSNRKNRSQGNEDQVNMKNQARNIRMH